MSLVAKLSYNEGACVCPKIQLVIGFLPNKGSTLLAISDRGLVGFIAAPGNKTLGPLKTGLQLKIREGGSIAWSEALKQYVAVGGNGCIARSCNSLIWEYIENPSLKGLSKVIWNESLGHYITVGKAGTILVSKDGKNWQISEANSKVNLNDILWCPVNRQYVLIGDAGYIALSGNGVNWQTQTNPVKSNLLAIASTAQWNNKLKFVIVTKQDEILESEDAKNWCVSLAKVATTKGMVALFYNHIYGNGGTKKRGVYRFFSIMSSRPSPAKGIYRNYRYYTHGNENNLRYTYTSSWKSGYIYLRDYLKKDSPQVSAVKRVLWFDELKLFIAVAGSPPVLFNDGNSNASYVFDRIAVEPNFFKFIEDGFSDITLGSIPNFKGDEKTAYYDLSRYS